MNWKSWFGRRGWEGDLEKEEDPFTPAVTLRVEGPEAALMGSIRAVLREVDAGAPILGAVRTMDEQVDEALRRERLLAVLGGAVGLALLLVALGLYGVLAGNVARRTSEIGIRMALGACRAGVVWLFLREGMTLVALGLAAGVGAAVYVARLLRSQLFGVALDDPATFAVMGGVLLAVVLAASLLPALRASRIDPIVALRCE